jgi:PAS domain S-box-containing protein
LEKRIINKNKNIVHVRNNVSLVRDTDGKPINMIVLVQDISKEFKAQEVARESEQRALFLFEAIPQKVWIGDENGNVDYCNQYWLDYTGLHFDDLKEWGWAKVIHPDDLSESVRRWRHSLENAANFQIEHRFRRYDGEYRWHLSRGIPRKDENGKVVMWIGTNTDIHDQKMGEQKLQQSRNELKEANEELNKKNLKLEKINNDLDTFVYTASHDLKAPVNNLEGLVELLSKKYFTDNPQAAAVIDMMRNSILKFKYTIKDLTEIAKVESGADSFDVERLKFSELVEDVKSTILPQIERTNAMIVEDYSDAPEISFSHKNIKSVIYNLLSNAIKYRHPMRRPEVKITTEKVNDSCILLKVKDNGLGIKETDKAKVFNMFQRLHDHVEGTGVGMAIVKRIIDNSGGKIEIESEPDKGSTFNIYINGN